MAIEIVATKRSPQAVGPYSQAVAAHGFLYVSGQLPMDPETGQMVDGKIEDQTRRAMNNMRAILEAAEVSMSDVVKTTIYLKDMEDFAAVNGAYAEYFPSNPPARACFEVARLPKDARVEIECVAALPTSS